MSMEKYMNRVVGSLTVIDYLDAKNTRIQDLATPILPSDAATKSYVDNAVFTSNLTAGNGLTLTGSILSVNTSQTQVNKIGNINQGLIKVKVEAL